MRFVVMVLIGVCAGALMGYLGKCTTGACPLTATPLRGAGFGAVFGILIALSSGTLPLGGRTSFVESEYIARVSSMAGLEALIAGSDVPVLVDFYADWCGPCKRLAPELSALANTWQDKALIVKVNVDKQSEIASAYKISSIPDIRIFAGGEQRLAASGYKSQARLHEMLISVGGVPPSG